MIPLIAAGALSALSIGSSVAQNQAIGRTASANAEATEKMLLQQYGVQTEQLQDAAEDVNVNLGVELTNLVYSSMASQGSAAAVQAQSNAYGATAGRIQGNIRMKEALTADQMTQAAESKMIEIQNEMRNAKYSYESGSAQNKMSFNNTMSQQQSGLSMLASGLSTGLSAYSALGGTFGTTAQTGTAAQQIGAKTTTEQSLIYSGQASPTLIGSL